MNKPEICRVTPYEGGETVQIFGENFDRESLLYWWRKNEREDTDIKDCGFPGTAAPELPPEDAKCVKLRDAVNGQVAYLGPEQEVWAGANVFWIKNEAGFSKPFIANEPRLWSQSVTRIYPGGIVSVYGDCMWSTEHKFAYLKDVKTGEFIEAPVLPAKAPIYYFGVHRHRTNIRVPATIKDGEYEVYINGGTGSEYGWSNPLKISVESQYSLTEYFRTKWNRDTTEAIPMPKCDVISVTANPLGALYDITDEIQAALDKAHDMGGGIVMLSSGTYGISRTLKLKDGVILMGAGEGSTTVKVAENCVFESDWSDVSYAYRNVGRNRFAKDWKPHWDRYNHKPLARIYNDAGIEGVKFLLGSGANMGVLVANNTEDFHTFGAFINYVTVDGSGLYTYEDKGFGNLSAGLVTVGANTELTVYKCSLTAMAPVYILPAHNRYSRIIRNRIECAPRNYDESFFNGMMNSTIIENDFIDGRRSMMCQMQFEKNFVYQNRSRGVTRGSNANEVYMSEYGETFWGGYPAEIGEDYIAIDRRTGLFCEAEKEDFGNESDGIYGAHPGELTNEYIASERVWLVIIDGRGFGQYRAIDRVEDNRVYIDRPWDIAPDSTTAFSITFGAVNNIWLDNASELSNSHSQFIWNCGIENIIAGHEVNMSAGIRLYANAFYGIKNSTCVLAFNRIVHCVVRGSGKGLWLNSDGFRLQDRPAYVQATGGGIFANSVRACAFDGSKDMIYVKNLPHTMTDSNPKAGVAVGGAYNTFCRNRIGGYVNAVRLLDNCLGNCFDTNYYSNNDLNMSGAGQPIGNDVSTGRAKLD